MSSYKLSNITELAMKAIVFTLPDQFENDNQIYCIEQDCITVPSQLKINWS